MGTSYVSKKEKITSLITRKLESGESQFFLFNFSAVPQSSPDSDIATAFQRRFHISVDESEQNNVSMMDFND